MGPEVYLHMVLQTEHGPPTISRRRGRIVARVFFWRIRAIARTCRSGAARNLSQDTARLAAPTCQTRTTSSVV